MATPVLPAIQAGVGIAQGLAGALMKNKRPDFYSDEYLDKRESLARERLKNPYAEAARAQESADLAISDNVDNIRSGKVGGRVDESALFGAAMKSRMGIADKIDANRRLATASLDQVLDDKNRYTRDKWQYEKADRFKERAAAKSALIGSGISNMFGSINSYMDSKAQKDYLDTLSREDVAKMKTLTPAQQKEFLRSKALAQKPLARKLSIEQEDAIINEGRIGY